MVKLLFCMENLYPLLGGAERSIDTLIRALDSNPRYSTSYLCTSNYNEHDSNEMFATHDVIITQLNWAKTAIRGAREHGKKSVQFVRSLEGFCKVAIDSLAVSHCRQQCGSCAYRMGRDELEIPDLLIANSFFTQRMLLEQYGLHSEIVFPFIDVEEVRAETNTPKYIVMNQFAYHKGADIFLNIAKALPEYEFKIFGSTGWMPSYTIPQNVELVGPVPSKEIYREALLFLAPSRINESFGRCVVEAQINGVPVLASNRGGPRYDNLVLDEYRVDEIDDIEPWVEKIRSVLTRRDEVAVQVRSRDFSFCSTEQSVRTFLSLLEALGTPSALKGASTQSQDSFNSSRWPTM